VRPPRPRTRAGRLLVPAALAGALAAAAAAARSGAAQPLPPRHGAGSEFAVVVHASNPATTMPREQLARLFLRKMKRWPTGAPAEPVDLAPGAPTRAAFTEHVLGKSVGTVRAYWQQRIFSGSEVPPPEKAAESEVLEFVRTHPAAVAYVSASVPLPPGVRALVVTD
jgi:ABC-type phosphate transport system substrate-binding protein